MKCGFSILYLVSDVLPLPLPCLTRVLSLPLLLVYPEVERLLHTPKTHWSPMVLCLHLGPN